MVKTVNALRERTPGVSKTHRPSIIEIIYKLIHNSLGFGIFFAAPNHYQPKTPSHAIQLFQNCFSQFEQA